MKLSAASLFVCVCVFITVQGKQNPPYSLDIGCLQLGKKDDPDKLWKKSPLQGADITLGIDGSGRPYNNKDIYKILDTRVGMEAVVFGGGRVKKICHLHLYGMRVIGFWITNSHTKFYTDSYKGHVYLLRGWVDSTVLRFAMRSDSGKGFEYKVEVYVRVTDWKKAKDADKNWFQCAHYAPDKKCH